MKQTTPTTLSDLAHELWAAAQLAPGEGVADGAGRVEAILPRPEQAQLPAEQQDAVDAARWRQLLLGQAMWVSGFTDKGKPWSVYLSPRDHFGWSEAFTKVIDEQSKKGTA